MQLDRSWILYLPHSLLLAALSFGACDLSERPTDQNVGASSAEGIETELVEVGPDEWRIADERIIPDSGATRVIARGLNGVTDTFGLQELRQPVDSAGLGNSPRDQHRSSFSNILVYGLIANRMFGGGMGLRPNPGAYVSPAAYNRVQSGAGARLNGNVRRTPTSAPRSGSSGFGRRSGGGRSFGG